VLAVSQNSSLAALLIASLIAVYAGLVKELVSGSKTLILLWRALKQVSWRATEVLSRSKKILAFDFGLSLR
jgi:hypothetical protein